MRASSFTHTLHRPSSVMNGAVILRHIGVLSWWQHPHELRNVHSCCDRPLGGDVPSAPLEAWHSRGTFPMRSQRRKLNDIATMTCTIALASRI